MYLIYYRWRKVLNIDNLLVFWFVCENLGAYIILLCWFSRWCVESKQCTCKLQDEPTWTYIIIRTPCRSDAGVVGGFFADTSRYAACNPLTIMVIGYIKTMLYSTMYVYYYGNSIVYAIKLGVSRFYHYMCTMYIGLSNDKKKLLCVLFDNYLELIELGCVIFVSIHTSRVNCMLYAANPSPDTQHPHEILIGKSSSHTGTSTLRVQQQQQQ